MQISHTKSSSSKASTKMITSYIELCILVFSNKINKFWPIIDLLFLFIFSSFTYNTSKVFTELIKSNDF